jgi:hypothetical protein
MVAAALTRRPPPMSRSVKVMKKSEGKVVPKKAPSTVWKRELGGVYTSKHEGQKLDRLVAGAVVQADRENSARVAVDARTRAKMLELVLLSHLLDARPRGDVALVYEAVQQLSGAFYHAEIGRYPQVSAVASPAISWRALLAEHFVVLFILLFFFLFILVVFGLDVQDHLQRLLVHGHLRLQAREVEVILDKVLGNFRKVFVAEQPAERGYPRLCDLGGGRHAVSLRDGVRQGVGGPLAARLQRAAIEARGTKMCLVGVCDCGQARAE